MSSSLDLTALAVSVICSPSTSVKPLARSASHPVCDKESTASLLFPPPCAFIKSKICPANSFTNSTPRFPAPKK